MPKLQAASLRHIQGNYKKQRTPVEFDGHAIVHENFAMSRISIFVSSFIILFSPNSSLKMGLIRSTPRTVKKELSPSYRQCNSKKSSKRLVKLQPNTILPPITYDDRR